MEKYFVGELIKKRRAELKLTQEQLCEGICEPITISRLENGRQVPSMNKLCVLLQRLGLPDDKYYALLSKNETQISNLQAEIISCNVLTDVEKGLKKIEELELIVDKNDTLLHQFILRSKVLLGKIENNQVIPYQFDEELNLLLEAIRLTAPMFDIDEIQKGLYSIDEIKVINQIAVAYSNNGQSKKAIDIYHQLLQYIKDHFFNILQSSGLFPLVSFNYARELSLNGCYQDAIQIAQMGWNSCVQYGQYRSLPATIALMAECYHFLNQEEKSKELYRQAYFVYKAIGNEQGSNVVKSEIKKYFSSDFTL